MSQDEESCGAPPAKGGASAAQHDPFTSDPFAPRRRTTEEWRYVPKLEHTVDEAGLSSWAPWWMMTGYRLSAFAWLFGYAVFMVSKNPAILESLDILNHFTLAVATLLLGVCSAHAHHESRMRTLPSVAILLYHVGASIALFIVPFGIVQLFGRPLFHHPAPLTWVVPALIFLFDALFFQARVRFHYSYVWLVLASYSLYFLIFVVLSLVVARIKYSILQVCMLLASFAWMAACSAISTFLTYAMCAW